MLSTANTPPPPPPSTKASISQARCSLLVEVAGDRPCPFLSCFFVCFYGKSHQLFGAQSIPKTKVGAKTILVPGGASVFLRVSPTLPAVPIPTYPLYQKESAICPSLFHLNPGLASCGLTSPQNLVRDLRSTRDVGPMTLFHSGGSK